jgi:hypothetical protein
MVYNVRVAVKLYRIKAGTLGISEFVIYYVIMNIRNEGKIVLENRKLSQIKIHLTLIDCLVVGLLSRKFF